MDQPKAEDHELTISVLVSAVVMVLAALGGWKLDGPLAVLCWTLAGLGAAYLGWLAIVLLQYWLLKHWLRDYF